MPVVVASPFTRGDSANPRVVSTVFDHTSVLKLIEWRYHLRPLTARDASDDVGNLVQALDFAHRDATVPPLPVPSPPLIVPCLTGVPPSDMPVEAVQLLAPQP